MAVALAVHELATNAAKYGALSTSEGLLSISGKFENNGIELAWVEADGPMVSLPKGEGFGSRLLNRIVPAYFEGRGVSSFPPSGVTYHLVGKVITD